MKNVFWIVLVVALVRCGTETTGSNDAGTDAGTGTAISAPSLKTCASTNECLVGETCFTGFPHGLCSRSCLDSKTCASGFTCEIVTSTLNVCLKQCQKSSECRSDLVCAVGQVATISACGAIPDVCSVLSKCSADRQYDSAQIQDCRTKLIGCTAQKTAFSWCMHDHQACTVDNKTDGNVAFALCQSEFRAENDCIATLRDGGP